MAILRVIAAAAVGFAYGAAHYITLSKPWMKAAGIKLGPDGRPQGNGSALPFLLSGIGLFLIVPWMMMTNAYPGRPFLLTVIDGGYAVIGCGLMGLVLGVM